MTPRRARMARTSIIVVTYNHREFVGPCVRALEAAGLPADTRLLLVDNASEDGTAQAIRDEVLDPGGTRTRGGLPAVFVASSENLGFAGGNNLALRRALDDGDEFAYLLNPDTEAAPGFLQAALATAADPRIALTQSLLLRPAQGGGQPAVVNSWGNQLHVLGFGAVGGDGATLAAAEAGGFLRAGRDIGYASGAGVLARLAALRDVGLFDEGLFAYHEDLELSWRAWLAGYRVVLTPASRVVHRYDFARSPRKHYFMERNRWRVLLASYRWRTLALLAPALALMEAGVWALALRQGWLASKARAAAHLWRPTTWSEIARARGVAQALRKVGDREILGMMTGQLTFPGGATPWLLARLANPLCAAYLDVLRRIVVW